MEIGSEHGGSAAIMAAALQPPRMLIALDFWEPSHSCTLGTLPDAVENWNKAGVMSRIVPIKAKSPEAPIAPKNDIGFLWIDGDHSADGVREDFERWSEYVPYKGLIGFHDYDCPSGPGVKDFVDALLASDQYEEHGRIDNMVVIVNLCRRGEA